ncbi:MAG: mechanosensitive ion channel domain-containing protein [Candidatus Bathyarchaeota archaeon]
MVGEEALGFLTSVYAWIDTNLGSIVASAVLVFLLLLVYRVISSNIDRLRTQEVLDPNSAFLINRLVKWTFYLVVTVVVFNVLGVKVDLFLGFWVLAGGTIIGFASMSTIGNAIAGLILMVSRPFKIRDRLLFQDQYVEVEGIDLIYTRMRTLDNVLISVPNQMVLDTVIQDYSTYNVVRRRCVVTADYSEKPQRVRELLLEAVKKVDLILEEPKPFVWVTDLQSFAMEYTLFYFIDDVMKIIRIDSGVREAVHEVLTEAGIDMTTPNLIKTV